MSAILIGDRLHGRYLCQNIKIKYASVSYQLHFSKRKKKKIQGIKTNSIVLASPYLSAHKCKIFNPPTHSEHFE